MTTAKFTADKADPSWFPRVLNVLARDYPEINDKVWSTAIGENADEQVAQRRPEEVPAEPLTDVPMVCTACRKPVKRAPGRWAAFVWEHESDGDQKACLVAPVMAMVAAGNENVR